MKMKHYPNLKIDEFTSFLVKRRGHFFRLLEPFRGNILIIGRKR